MPVDFIAVDVETANADLASICQIGLVKFVDGRAVRTWSQLIDPEDVFSPTNVMVHGIDEASVRDAPTLPDVWPTLTRRIADAVVVSHTSFDRTAINRAADKYGLDAPDCRWLDSAKVARRAWSEFSASGYGLLNLAESLGVNYVPHDAAEDARAAGEVLVHAVNATGLSLEGWLERVKLPIAGTGSSGRIAMDGDPDGPLFGEVVVFTGALSMPRREAAQAASRVGCRVSASVTKSTTLLVLGDQDVRRVGDEGKSSKQRKAERLIADGLPIRIVCERDFMHLVEAGG